MLIMGIWRIRNKNGVLAERKPVELGSQVWRQKGERLKEGCVCVGGGETDRERQRRDWKREKDRMC